MTELDCISPLLQHFRIRTRLFHAGPLCGSVPFDAQPGRGFLHVMRGGELEVSYQFGGPPQRVHLSRPTLLFYPRPMEHAFHHAPSGESDFVCASLDFDGGTDHPLVRTLPPVVMVPLADLAPLGPAIEMLFAEVDNSDPGNRILVDRLFEVVLIQFYRWMLDRTEELSLPAGLFNGLADARMAPLLLAIHEDPGQDWSLAAMASKATMSRAAFAALFRDLVGQTPNEYLTAWRMTVAQDRLRAGENVGRTANSVGYSSAAAFSRVFAQRTGRSPRQWQRDAQGQ